MGKTVWLRPIEMDDYPMLRTLELSDWLTFRWRHRGQQANPDQFHMNLWSSVLTQYLVIDLASGRPLGMTSAYQPDYRNGTVYVAVAKFDELNRSLNFLAGCFLFLDHLFRGWPFRKLYFDVPDFNMPLMRGAIGKLLEEEGCLRQHVFLDGVYWDMHIFALYRERWSRRREALLAHQIL